MKTLAILALASLSLAAGCVAEPDPIAESGRHVGFRPSVDRALPEEQLDGYNQRQPPSDRPDINESFEIGAHGVRQPGPRLEGSVIHDGLELEGSRPLAPRDPLLEDGRVMWVEEVIIDNSRFDYVHQFDAAIGVDTIDVLDGDGALVCSIIVRRGAVEMSTCTLR